MAWNLIGNYTFPGADTLPGVAGSTTGLGVPFVDINGSVAQVSNHQAKVKGLNPSVPDFINSLVQITDNLEADQRIVVGILAGGDPSFTVGTL